MSYRPIATVAILLSLSFGAQTRACVTHDERGASVACGACFGEMTQHLDAARDSQEVHSFANARGGSGESVVTVHVLDFGYSINPTGPFVDPIIHVGDTVHWQFDTPHHTVTSVLGSPETFQTLVIAPGGTFDHTFSTPGTFTYYCEVHGFDNGNGSAEGMFGYVTVLAAPVAGDFNGDTLVNAADIDLLFAASPGPVPPANSLYDVNSDSQVVTTPNTSGSDSDYWVRTIKSTEYGDTNLDGKVNFDDLLVVAQNYGATVGAGWAAGSVNGDGAVNFDDLLVLAQNYGHGTLLGDSGSLNFSADWALALSLAPEPASLSFASAVFVGLARRVRRC